MKPILPLVAITALLPSTLNAGNCHQIYHRQAIVQHAYVQPVVYFSVGDNLRIEAIVEKKLRERESQGGTLQQRQSVLAEKCARCHSGESAKGGFDLTQPISDYHLARTVEVLSGFEVPTAMKGVIESLQPADKGGITEELIRKRLAKPKEPEEGILR